MGLLYFGVLLLVFFEEGLLYLGVALVELSLSTTGFEYSPDLGLIPVLPFPDAEVSDLGVRLLSFEAISDLVVVYFLSGLAAAAIEPLLAIVVSGLVDPPVPGVVLPTEDLPPLDLGIVLPPAPRPLG